MAALKRMLQVGIKAENCLMRYRALKSHSTSSSSSSKEFSGNKARPHPEHERVGYQYDFEREMGEIYKRMDSYEAERLARHEKWKRETRDYYKSRCEAIEKNFEKLGIGSCVGICVVTILSLIAGSSKKGVPGPSP